MRDNGAEEHGIILLYKWNAFLERILQPTGFQRLFFFHVHASRVCMVRTKRESCARELTDRKWLRRAAVDFHSTHCRIWITRPSGQPATIYNIKYTRAFQRSRRRFILYYIVYISSRRRTRDMFSAVSCTFVLCIAYMVYYRKYDVLLVRVKRKIQCCPYRIGTPNTRYEYCFWVFFSA